MAFSFDGSPWAFNGLDDEVFMHAQLEHDIERDLDPESDEHEGRLNQNSGLLLNRHSIDPRYAEFNISEDEGDLNRDERLLFLEIRLSILMNRLRRVFRRCWPIRSSIR